MYRRQYLLAENPSEKSRGTGFARADAGASARAEPSVKADALQRRLSWVASLLARPAASQLQPLAEVDALLERLSSVDLLLARPAASHTRSAYGFARWSHLRK